MDDYLKVLMYVGLATLLALKLLLLCNAANALEKALPPWFCRLCRLAWTERIRFWYAFSGGCLFWAAASGNFNELSTYVFLSGFAGALFAITTPRGSEHGLLRMIKR